MYSAQNGYFVAWILFKAYWILKHNKYLHCNIQVFYYHFISLGNQSFFFFSLYVQKNSIVNLLLASVEQDLHIDLRKNLKVNNDFVTRVFSYWIYFFFLITFGAPEKKWDAVLQVLRTSLLQNYSSAKWIFIYTDGSASDDKTTSVLYFTVGDFLRNFA